MGIHQIYTSTHWNYFLSLEDDILLLSRWIEFNDKNFECYSLELARLLMTISAEFEVIAKLICKYKRPESRPSSINAYQKILTGSLKNIPNVTITIPRFGLTFTPFVNWVHEDKPPFWWSANNKVKHDRSNSFHQATLKNVLNASAALFYLLVLYQGEIVGDIPSMPKLFESFLIDETIDGSFIYNPHKFVIHNG